MRPVLYLFLCCTVRSRRGVCGLNEKVTVVEELVHSGREDLSLSSQAKTLLQLLTVKRNALLYMQ